MTIAAFPTEGPCYDAVVVGARAAGAATAMMLARQGRRALLIDRAQYGSDTLSTHALMRAGVLKLRRWGLLDRVVAAGTPAVRRSVFHYGDEDVAVPIKGRPRRRSSTPTGRTSTSTATSGSTLRAGARG